MIARTILRDHLGARSWDQIELHAGLRIPGVLYAAAAANGVTVVALLLLLRRTAPAGTPAATGIGRFSWGRLLAYAAPGFFAGLK